MNKAKQAKLERKGWEFGTADEFLNLSADELAYIELKLALSDKLKAKRVSKKLTQAFYFLIHAASWISGPQGIVPAECL